MIFVLLPIPRESTFALISKSILFSKIVSFEKETINTIKRYRVMSAINIRWKKMAVFLRCPESLGTGSGTSKKN